MEFGYVIGSGTAWIGESGFLMRGHWNAKIFREYPHEVLKSLMEKTPGFRWQVFQLNCEMLGTWKDGEFTAIEE